MSKQFYQRVLPGVAVLAATFSAPPRAIASTQPINSDNPFATDDIPGMINSTAGIELGEAGSFPNFPGIPDGALPDTPRDILGTVNDVLKSPGESAIQVLGRTLPGGLPAGIPDIFSDILGGDIGDILSSLFDIFATEHEIFQDISKVVLGDGWEAAGQERKAGIPPDPYKVRLPAAGDAATSDTEDEAVGLLTRTPMAFRRDKANQYDQELGRAMAAPMLGESGQGWIDGEIELSADMLQSGAASAFSILGKSTNATQATSTQDIVRASAEMGGLAANMQLQAMQQTAKMQQSLWQMQRLNSAQLQLAADMSEAADEANRRERTGRSAGLYGSANAFMILPSFDTENSTSTTSGEAHPDAPQLFAE